MAQFTNQAQLTFGDTVVNSNIAVGEILDALSADKNASQQTYSRGDRITYVISATNTSGNPINNLTVTDNLGAYTLGAVTVYPLEYVEGSLLLYINGVLSASPDVTAGPPLVFGNISLPAGANMVLVYNATVNGSAPLTNGATVTNVATITGAGADGVQVSETVTAIDAPSVTVTKSIDPTPVAQGDRVTYRFLIQNFGNTAIVVTDEAVITDTLSPALTNLAVAFDGAIWTEGTNYTYDETTGLFATLAGQVVVPAATYTQAADGTITVLPGSATLTLTGNIAL